MSSASSGSQRTPSLRTTPPPPGSPRSAGGSSMTDSWRVLLIMGDSSKGSTPSRTWYMAFTVFGSARTPPEEPFYEKAVETVAHAGRRKDSLVTAGGGP